MVDSHLILGKIEWLYLLKDKLLTEEFEDTDDEALQMKSEKLSDYYVIVLRNKDQDKAGAKHYM